MSKRHSDEKIRVRLLAKSGVLAPEVLTLGVACRVFLGSRRGGYGRMTDGERLRDAHRLSFEVNKGPIPEGKDVCHHCDNPGCIEPVHLWAGTKKENTADMIRKGRHLAGRSIGAEKRRGQAAPWVRGGRHKLSKLTEAGALAVLASTEPARVLAERLGVSDSLIRGIRQGKNWGWLNKVARPVRKAREPVYKLPAAHRVRKAIKGYEDYPVGPLRLRDVFGKGKK